PGSQTIRFADTNTPDSKAKPFGASELQLFLGVGTNEPAPVITIIPVAVGSPGQLLPSEAVTMPDLFCREWWR
ncbi:MAG: hypothetical protein L0Y44_16360, partial [Phycisphaerales bacterium]|nr:hypothetical protein [Phycisphaerales bacterium]